MQDLEFKILGKTWLWRHTRLVGRAYGWTIWPEKNTKKKAFKILIDERLKGKKLLEVQIHEFTHAACPFLSEEHVTLQGRDLSTILWSLGYRLQKETE